MAELDDLLRDGPDALVELYRQAEDDILIDMARRIKEYDFFIPAARFQKAKLEAMGLVWQEILRRLSALTGRTQEELTAGKEALLSSLRATSDSPGAIEGYYATACLSSLNMTPERYMEAVEKVSLADVVAAAQTVTLHSTYFLKGESQ